MTKEEKTKYEKEYINWFNNYISVAKFAEDMNYTEKHALEVLKVGKEYHFDKALNASTFEEMVNFKLHKEQVK